MSTIIEFSVYSSAFRSKACYPSEKGIIQELVKFDTCIIPLVLELKAPNVLDQNTKDNQLSKVIPFPI